MYRKSNGIITAQKTTQEVKRAPFSKAWRVYQKISECCYMLYRVESGKAAYKTLYIHTFRFLVKRYLTQTQQFLHENPDPYALTTVSDKLKWYRFQNGLLQRDVAKAMGVDRTTYARYEEAVLDAYPLDKLAKAAECFHVDVTALLDAYNLFLYHGQGQQIKRLRKAMKLTQSGLAELLGVSLGTVKRWEQEQIKLSKLTYLSLPFQKFELDS